MVFAKASNKTLTQRSESYCYLYYKEMDWPAAGLEYDSRAVGCVLCRPHAGLTGCTSVCQGLCGATAPFRWTEADASALDISSKRCYFIGKAEAACAAPALKLFCSICTTIQRLHRIWNWSSWLILGPLSTRRCPTCTYNLRFSFHQFYSNVLPCAIGV